jgi:hypothetical protein
VALRTIINDQIANYLVLPHKIPVSLIETLEEALFMIPKVFNYPVTAVIELYDK